MSLTNLIEQAATFTPSEFLAPVPSGNDITLFSYQGNLPFFFRLRDPKPGWHIIKPISPAAAVIDREARIAEYMQYKNQMRRHLAIHIETLDENTYVAVPYNPNGTGKDWQLAEPRVVHITKGNRFPSPLTPVVVRQATGFLVHDAVSTPHYRDLARVRLLKELDKPEPGYVMLRDGYRVAYDIILDRVRKERERLEKEKRRTHEQSEIGRIEKMLALSGAQLLSAERARGGFVVKYRYNEAEFTVPITASGRIVSAGICLNGRDADYDLATVVGVLEEGRRRRRFDIPEELWL